jgi:hypothetical protein
LMKVHPPTMHNEHDIFRPATLSWSAPWGLCDHGMGAYFDLHLRISFHGYLQPSWEAWEWPMVVPSPRQSRKHLCAAAGRLVLGRHRALSAQNADCGQVDSNFKLRHYRKVRYLYSPGAAAYRGGRHLSAKTKSPGSAGAEASYSDWDYSDGAVGSGGGCCHV